MQDCRLTKLNKDYPAVKEDNQYKNRCQDFMNKIKLITLIEDTLLNRLDDPKIISILKVFLDNLAGKWQKLELVELANINSIQHNDGAHSNTLLKQPQ